LTTEENAAPEETQIEQQSTAPDIGGLVKKVEVLEQDLGKYKQETQRKEEVIQKLQRKQGRKKSSPQSPYAELITPEVAQALASDDPEAAVKAYQDNVKRLQGNQEAEAKRQVYAEAWEDMADEAKSIGKDISDEEFDEARNHFYNNANMDMGPEVARRRFDRAIESIRNEANKVNDQETQKEQVDIEKIKTEAYEKGKADYEAKLKEENAAKFANEDVGSVGQQLGIKPTLEQVRDTDPMEVKKKVQSGEWVLPGNWS
jgi:hypothetical protein